MSVLDPFEVAFIEIWPMDNQVAGMSGDEIKTHLDKAEFTVFQKVLVESKLGTVLNEKPPHATETIELPASYRERIVPDSFFHDLKHPDVRIARRATTIANLARVIGERNVSSGLRVTLLTQARRLERLAVERLRELSIEIPDRKDI